MSVGSTFDNPREFLSELLKRIGNGKIQLPDFQRGWIWDDDHVRSLLASVSLAYPIGAVMAMVTGNADVRFKPRLFEGVSDPNPPDPEWLILDGQQRLTALYQALRSDRPVSTLDSRQKPIRRWYYLDIEKALNPAVDREDAILALPEDKITRNFRGEPIDDYSSREMEYLCAVFPFSEILSSSDWRMGFSAFWDYAPDKLRLFDQFEAEIIKRFEQYLVPLIVLGRETPKEAVCQIFEKVNTGGVPLTVFELLTATFAADNFNLREDWDSRSRRFRNDKILAGVQNTDFLQAVTLLATRDRRRQVITDGTSEDRAPAVSCKRKDVLRLTLDEYQCWVDDVTQAFVRIPRLLHSQKIFVARDVPYRTQLTPLAAILTVLGKKAESDGVRSKLVQWYWCGVFGELYGSATETRFAKDLSEVLAWIDGSSEPDTVGDAHFAPARLLSLRTRNSAAYKGLYALLIKDGGLDFRTGEAIDVQTYADEQIDIHHIFPQDWCHREGVDDSVCNSIVNKTPLSARTNRMIGGNAPSLYLERIQQSARVPRERMDEILSTHVIDPIALRADDFEAFFESRRRALLDRIERAMGKPIAWESLEPVGADVMEDYEVDEA